MNANNPLKRPLSSSSLTGNISGSTGPLTIGGVPMVQSQPSYQQTSSIQSPVATQQYIPPTTTIHAPPMSIFSNIPSSSSSSGNNPSNVVPITTRFDPNAPPIFSNEIRSAKESIESESIIKNRTEFIKNKLNNMSEEQLNRFEFFVRSHFPKNRVREVMNEALGPKQLVTDEMVIVVSGLAKLFVGELCDSASEVMRETNQAGIHPDHIQEAYRRMQNKGQIGHPSDNRFFFDNISFSRFQEFPYSEDSFDYADQDNQEEADEEGDHQDQREDHHNSNNNKNDKIPAESIDNQYQSLEEDPEDCQQL